MTRIVLTALFSLGLIITLFSCKAPVVIAATEENFAKEYNCEVGFFSEKPFTSVDSFKIQCKKEIKREGKRCKCDTLIIKLNEVKGYHVYGHCKSNK